MPQCKEDAPDCAGTQACPHVKPWAMDWAYLQLKGYSMVGC